MCCFFAIADCRFPTVSCFVNCSTPRSVQRPSAASVRHQELQRVTGSCPHFLLVRLIQEIRIGKIPKKSRPTGGFLKTSGGPQQLGSFCGWTKSILHHLRNPGMMITLQIPTNHWFPRFLRCRISSIHSSSLLLPRSISQRAPGGFRMRWFGSTCRESPPSKSSSEGLLVGRDRSEGPVLRAKHPRLLNCGSFVWFGFGG